MTRYFLRFPPGETWTEFRTLHTEPRDIAREAAARKACSLPVTIDVRGDKERHFETFTIEDE